MEGDLSTGFDFTSLEANEASHLLVFLLAGHLVARELSARYLLSLLSFLSLESFVRRSPLLDVYSAARPLFRASSSHSSVFQARVLLSPTVHLVFFLRCLCHYCSRDSVTRAEAVSFIPATTNT